MKIEPHDEMGGAVLNCAVRYALGRASYMPGLVMDEIRPMIGNLTPKTLYCMDRDIWAWICDTGNQKNPYWEDWVGFQKLVREQLEKRRVETTPGEDEQLDSMTFSKRMALTKVFEKWADENCVAKTPASVVTFLYGYGLLNVDAAGQFILEHSEESV